MNAEPEHLASAYLDGELTDEERRIAEADPAVMAEVEQLRALRSELSTPPPPSDAARETAITAAMAEFARTHGAPAATTSPDARVVPYRPRPAWAGWLSAAAAILVIGVLGIAVVAGVRGGDDDDSAAEHLAEEPAAEEPADDAARITEAAPTAADDADAASDEPAIAIAEADEPAEESAEEPAADEMADASGGEEPAAEEPAMEAPAEEPAEEPADGADIGDPVEYLDDGRQIVAPDELTVVGAYLAERVADRTIGATPEHACPYQNVLATADVLDPGTGELTPVFLDVATDENLVRAVDRESCVVLLDAPLEPEP
jgi:hypothetical protein